MIRLSRLIRTACSALAAGTRSGAILQAQILDGRTVYVGARDGAKYIRCYEKGFEILAKLGIPENIKSSVTKLEYNGVGMVKVEDLYRVEVEFKDVEKVLPYAMLNDRDSYFAGANPFCASCCRVHQSAR